MPIRIEDVRARIGLQPTDTSKDTELAVALETSLAVAEAYCNRKFKSQRDTETFTHIDSHVVSLRRYPVDTIINVSPNGFDYHLEKETGLIHVDGRVHKHALTIEYDGGYVAIPSDLGFAILMIFDSVWGTLQGDGQAQTGGVESVTLADVGTVRFSTSKSSSGDEDFAGLPFKVRSILDFYRRELC